MTRPVLCARQLRKSYQSGRNAVAVLRGVDLVLQPGESMSIRGVSGSGKSTLLQLLAGLEQPDGGEIQWEGQGIDPRRVGELSRQRARFLGMVFQSHYLMPEMNVLENVLLAARIAGRLSRQDGDRARSLLRELGLGERESHLPQQLSGGECQRVAIARALINSPRLILADEPTGNLDEANGAEVVELLLRMATEKGTAIILVTHHPGHAGRTGIRLGLHEGVLG